MQYLMTVAVCAQRHLTYMYMADDVLTFGICNMFNRVNCTYESLEGPLLKKENIFYLVITS